MSIALMGRAPTEYEIERGAAALRERQMSGRLMRDWASLPKSAKKKWIDHAEAVLRAAFDAR